MSDTIQNLICKITADIKSAEIGLATLQGYLQGKGTLNGSPTVPELPAPSLLLGENLRALRKQRKLTTIELGEIFGVTNATISKYEKGERKPTPEMLANLADYFGVTIDYLLGRRGK